MPLLRSLRNDWWDHMRMLTETFALRSSPFLNLSKHGTQPGSVVSTCIVYFLSFEPPSIRTWWLLFAKKSAYFITSLIVFGIVLVSASDLCSGMLLWWNRGVRLHFPGDKVCFIFQWLIHRAYFGPDWSFWQINAFNLRNQRRNDFFCSEEWPWLLYVFFIALKNVHIFFETSLSFDICFHYLGSKSALGLILITTGPRVY